MTAKEKAIKRCANQTLRQSNAAPIKRCANQTLRQSNAAPIKRNVSGSRVRGSVGGT
jgi:hypothetical protein